MRHYQNISKQDIELLITAQTGNLIMKIDTNCKITLPVDNLPLER